MFRAGALPRLLVGHLFNKKEPQQEGDSHSFDDTMRRLLSKLAMFHTISRSTPEVHSLQPSPSQPPSKRQKARQTPQTETQIYTFRHLDRLSIAETALIACEGL